MKLRLKTGVAEIIERDLNRNPGEVSLPPGDEQSSSDECCLEC